MLQWRLPLRFDPFAGGLCWHVPEAIRIASLGMGIPEDGQLVGVAIHAGFSALALLSWYFAKTVEVDDVVQDT